MSWTINLPEVNALSAAFEHPQLLRNPNPVSVSDGAANASADFSTLAAVVTISDGDWPALAGIFGAALGITQAAVTGDYVDAVSQSLATLDAAEGDWDDDRADLALRLGLVEVTFTVQNPMPQGASYYGYAVQAPLARWDRFVDDDDLVDETQATLHCNQLLHDINGAQVARGIPRRSGGTPVSGSDMFDPVINVGVGELRAPTVTHKVGFGVSLQATAPGDGLFDLLVDPTMLVEADPRMAARVPLVRLLVAAGTVDDLAQGLGLRRDRVVNLLKRRGMAKEEAVPIDEPSGGARDDDPSEPVKPAVAAATLSPRLPAPRPLQDRMTYFKTYIQPDFVPRNRLASRFVGFFDPPNVERVPHVVYAMDPLRRRRLAAGLGLGRDAAAEEIAAFLMKRVFQVDP